MAADQDRFDAIFGDGAATRPAAPDAAFADWTTPTGSGVPVAPPVPLLPPAEPETMAHPGHRAPAPVPVPAAPHPAGTAVAPAAVVPTTGATATHAAAAVPAAVPAALPTTFAVETPAAAASAVAAATAPAASSPAVPVPTFIPGDLVLSVYGDGAPGDSTTYTDNQASPIVLEQVTTAGALVNDYVLPQTAGTDAAGTTEYAISGEYGSSSEGSLSLSADGHSLVIMGYGVNAATYNGGGAAVYGNAALAQSTSVPGGPYTAVPRVVADINADGVVDTSTAVYDVFNTNNPRSVATVDGSSFYISGQGVKGDATQGLFLVGDGASSATAIDNTTDTRTAVLYDGVLYVSRDSKQGTDGFKYTSNISSYGGEPTAATTGTVLTGLSQSVTLTAAQENTVNGGSVGKSVDLSPENFFFANASTLYVADGGAPKGGGVGDGGLQKWTLGSTGWTLDYTLSQGLNLVANTATSGTTGLIGLTGAVSGNTVTLYATNATVGDLDQTYLFGITDQLGATTAPTSESFTTLVTAAADTNIRGVAFAPQVACFARGTRLLTADGAVPVEALRPGTRMVVERRGERVLEPACWIGRRRVDVAAHPDPVLVRPVRILPGALGEHAPLHPLVLSPDHAVRLDGALVPVRHLVNNASIAHVPVSTVEYFHVELPSHGILFAEGAAVESFLDTGNRDQFAGGPVIALHPSFVTPVGSGDVPGRSCLPFLRDEGGLRALWHRLAARSGELGHPVPAIATATDPVLRLLLPDGTRLRPSCADPCVGPQGFRFPVPLAAETVIRLLSRTVSPATLRPWLDDRRSLGVAVRAATAWIGGRPVALRPGAADGWWGVEHAPDASWRWTDGCAVLVLPAGADGLEVDLHAVSEYPRRIRRAA